MTVADLVVYTRRQLEADGEQQAHIKAAGVVGGHLQSQTGLTLNLSHLEIHALPVEVIALIKDRVERLALSHNPQVYVPPQISQCNRLKYLNLRANSLRHFPDAVLQLPFLEILDVSKNRIVSVPEGIKNMTSLKFLAVGKNRITRLPLALGDMPSLTKLKCDENPLEFPPAHVWEVGVVSESAESSPNSKEQERDVCQLVKRFLKAASLRERLRTFSSDNLSESNVETPRPLKRTATTGRFPVRPSIGGIEDMRTISPIGKPPIPQRNNARDVSSNGSTVRRPGIAPLLTGDGDVSRSRSETLTSVSSIKSRRQGLVAPKKTAINIDDLADPSGAGSIRSSQASTLRGTAAHSRATSSVSTLNGFLTASSGAETSSSTASPVDGPFGKFGPSRRLSSLPESRHSRVQSTNLVRSAKRVMFSLLQLHGPVSEVARAVKDGTPKRSVLERHMFGASAHVEELDRLLNKMANAQEEDDKDDEEALRSIAVATVAALRAYGPVIRELKQQTYRVVSLTEGVYLRCLMSQIYMTIIESRNICSSLGYTLKARDPAKTPRTSRAWSSRTVTPTQPKPITSKRMRGATILRSMSSNASIRTMPPPVSLAIVNSSRTNTMTSTNSAFSSTAPTPRSGETPSSTIPYPPTLSRTNTMHNDTTHHISNDYTDDTHLDQIYLKLHSASTLARHNLPNCHAEFLTRLSSNNQYIHISHHNTASKLAAHHWSICLQKCEAVISANNNLHTRLKVVKLKDPGVRTDFWNLCDEFVARWTELATEVKGMSVKKVDEMGSVRQVMRPVQKAVKEVSKVVSESPLYQSALRGGGQMAHSTAMMNGGGGGGGLGPAFPSTLNAALAQVVSNRGQHGYNSGLSSGYHSSGGGGGGGGGGSQNGHSGYVTPHTVPATPLSAALGPAAQATVAAESMTAEYFPTMQRPAGLERMNTVERVPQGR
ncbi:hypothetical protein LTR62_005599 [Meristemomyces frigidus]|uniref:Disease resistance R13L4/SHOC-2-like LRR domain-containing protein n=1 Tax=Meristemomyces frigidus TaxID=1508187 RepID=A0AAN7YF76_9PEZI|nr:hypothetical protein LTR62_005599 [Meristemomyces frigidus]